MMHSTPTRASARPSPVITSTPCEREIGDDVVPAGLQHLDDVTAHAPGCSCDCDLSGVCMISRLQLLGGAVRGTRVVSPRSVASRPAGFERSGRGQTSLQ